MKIFVPKRVNVFNPELVGQAVSLKVGDEPRNVVITSVQEDSITIAGVTGVKVCKMSHFESGEMSMELLKSDTEFSKELAIPQMPKKVRNNKQIENENMYLTVILREHGGAMHISQIVERMVAAGYPHWKTGNPSAHIITAQRWGQPIARERKGYYKYVGEVK